METTYDIMVKYKSVKDGNWTSNAEGWKVVSSKESLEEAEKSFSLYQKLLQQNVFSRVKMVKVEQKKTEVKST